jgi:hypothetical protein
VFREARTLYDVRRHDRDLVVLQWGTKLPDDGDGAAGGESKEAEDEKDEPVVVSGGIKGASEIVGKPAILDVPVGKGRVVAFDFDPIHRNMTPSDFRLVWNVLLNWNDLPAR